MRKSENDNSMSGEVLMCEQPGWGNLVQTTLMLLEMLLRNDTTETRFINFIIYIFIYFLMNDAKHQYTAGKT